MRYTHVALMFAISSAAAAAGAGDARIVDEETQAVRYVIEGNRVIPTEELGRKRYDRPYYTIEGDRIVPRDPLGRVLYGRGTLEVKRGK
jgi:hypothetical protein